MVPASRSEKDRGVRGGASRHQARCAARRPCGPCRLVEDQNAAAKTAARLWHCGNTTGRWHAPAVAAAQRLVADQACAAAGQQFSVLQVVLLPVAELGGPQCGARRSRSPSPLGAAVGPCRCRRHRGAPCRRTGCRTSHRRRCRYPSGSDRCRRRRGRVDGGFVAAQF